MLTSPIAILATALGLKFEDDFDRSDSTTLGEDWIEAQGNWSITTNKLATAVTPTIGDRVVRTETVANQAAECIPSTNLIGPCVRATETGTMNGYTARRQNATTVQLLRVDAGALTVLDAYTTSHTLGTDRLKIEAWGNSIRVYKNDALLGATSDTTYGTGNAGVAVTTTSAGTVDDFRAWWN